MRYFDFVGDFWEFYENAEDVRWSKFTSRRTDRNSVPRPIGNLMEG